MTYFAIGKQIIKKDIMYNKIGAIKILRFLESFKKEVRVCDDYLT